VTLIEFLTARLDEDEQLALRARGDYFSFEVLGRFSAVGDAAHVIRHAPARVLAEVEAKRQILADCMATIANAGAGPGEYGLALSTIQSLALPYADHDDYRQEWRP